MVFVDRLPPDVGYFLDCATECGHMAADTRFYFYELEPETAKIIDRLDDRERNQTFEKHWSSLRGQALALEDHYVSWRAQNPEARLTASLAGALAMPAAILRLAEEHASSLVHEGYTQLSANAIRYAQYTRGFEIEVAILKRAAVRAWHDLRLLSAEDLAFLDAGWRAEHQRRVAGRLQEIVERRDRELINLGEIAEKFQVYEVTIDDDYCTPDEYEARHGGGKAKQPWRLFRRHRKHQRRVLNRSLNFLSRLTGAETVRMFVNGQHVDIEGEHCIYRVKRSGTLVGSYHGGTTLTLHRKTDGAKLANLCIYTADVPIADHVAALIMHVRAGLEHEILKTGNLFAIKPEGRDEDWLQPFLPPPGKTHALNDVMAELIDLGERHPDEVPNLPHRRQRGPRIDNRTGKIADMRRHIMSHICGQVRPYYLRQASGLIPRAEPPDDVPFVPELMAG